ncbi:WD40-repeat-containing domain protein [Chytriomyces sp. MP71]|nr:WD40-repeat-containing domain protein [Chytriomyces sp. MP71]
MFCAISGEAVQEPVVSAKSGLVYEKRLALKHIADNGREPTTGDPLAEEDLIAINTNPGAVKPRAPTTNSVPSLLALLQSEFDAVMLETHSLKEAHKRLRHELSNALYENDAAKRVIARLVSERDQARAALADLSALAPQTAQPSSAHETSQGSGMEVDAEETNLSAVGGKENADKLDATAAILTKTRKKRKPPTGTATAAEIATYAPQGDIPSLHSTTHPGITALDLLSLPFTDPAHALKENWILTGGHDGAVIVSDWKRGVEVASVKAHGTKKVSAVAWVDHGPLQGKAFVSGSVDHAVKLFHVKENAGEEEKWTVGKASHVVKGHAAEVTGLAVHPCGEFVLSCSADSTWAFSDLERGVMVSQNVHEDGKEAYSSLAIHPDGLITATGTSDSIVRIWELKSAKCVATFADPQLSGPISSMSFSENGYYFATAAAESSVVKLWDLRKLECFHTMEVAGAESGKRGGGVRKVAFDYGAGFLGVACGERISVFRNKQWDEIVSFSPGSSPVVDFKWGARSQWIASASGTERKVVVTGV